MHLRRGTVGREKRDGEERGGGQYTANQGSEQTGIRATTQRRDFQVRGEFQRIRGGISWQQKGIIKRIGACTPVYILC
jgi:hypothetical protein